mmetsp:Transcript_30855/g.42744  ORF Transcript_30855/g.42744 Transcript_30855/m.42744 type:complete len:274 (+) Transcript_30855:115-936(+)|eukprot:CAMPEP_0196576896 /NCGR_PEP_ID=MMETSP1081-20130531/6055_1 /TAXON_ID=36882 /ORGANISM="Pyramimonas amylifera, Strain CCMP720" /LENGTH=273 /DNA_ID=CAMNT_0041895629 /DNA_START=94 /DNA_END=915 /DNA_ORIENTATION=-
MSAVKKKPLSNTENLVLGAFGGVIETCAQMPLITYKICVQEGRALPTNIPGWYRGVFANASSLAPITAVQVFSNGVLERAITAGLRETSESEKILAAMGAGSISALLYSPVDLLVIQQQKLKLGPGPAIAHIARTHGPQMLMRGFSACVVREAVYTAGYLGIAPVVKGRLEKLSPFWVENDVLTQFIGSCVGGTVAAMLTHPVDTAKTCIQGDLTKTNYRTATSTIPQLYAKGGIGILYKGGLARTARLCGAFFIINSLREAAMRYKGAHEEE